MENIYKNVPNENELKQSIFRVIFTAFIFAYLLFNQATKAEIIFVVSYLCVAIASFIFLNLYKKPSVIYRWLSLLSDVSAVSIGLYLTGSSGAIFLGVYLWLITGYGLRYGRNILFGAYALCIAGFLVAINFNEYWKNHHEMVAGFLVTLILIPLHVNVLLSRLAKATKAAELSSKFKSEFLSHISHEIRTPLNGAIGASYLLNQTQLNAEQKELTTIIVNSSTIVTDIISNVLDFSAIESGKIELSPTNINLYDFSENIISLLKIQAKGKKIEIINDYKLPKQSVYFLDPIRLKQVLINLLSNAIKFTENGYVKLTIEPSIKTNMICFKVSDTGIGIQQNALSKIFDSFSQADASIKGKFGGTGLGLTISSNLVNLMGATLTPSSEVGVGTTFEFTLDLSQNNAIVYADIKSFPDSIQKTSYKAANILVVEDNQINATIATKALLQVGHKVDLAMTGEDALDLLEKNSYDLILLDNNLPDYTGSELISIYRNLNVGLFHIPIVMLSADATIEEKNKLFSAGADAYLSKPLDIPLVLDTIDDLVQPSISNDKPSAQIIPIKRKSSDTKKSTNYIDAIQLTQLLKLDRNDNFFVKLIDTYINDTNIRLESLKEAIETNNYDQLQYLTHTMTGSASSMGAIELSRMLVNLHNLVPNSSEATKVFTQVMQIKEITFEELHTYRSKKITN